MLLAIDTSTKMLGIGLYGGDRVLAECVWYGEGHHTVELAPEIALVMRRVGKPISSIEAIGVAIGPGSFTGLRIGLALAKGLSLARGLPTVGIPTMDILALAQPKRTEPMFVAVKAGRKRIAGLWYKWTRGGWKPQGEPEVLTWDELKESVEEKAYICADMDSRTRALLRGIPGVALAPPAQCVRRPGFLAELAWKRLKSRKKWSVGGLSPIYLKPE
ncbi:MAG: tRNA (adenosine(37)-N6)-threonylcarbamoyltransferase complex dimerization subunit type 1 TsaB [Anaerolineales bacterium]|nr:tRNA (adenosine(37)-N6)-threonylcarbamoyltransferase complex dimerization subunit type 1 TsaB [Anaerolineales bacterium]